MSYALLTSTYFPLKKGCSYRILDEGLDWVSIKYKGSGIVVPRCLIHPDPMGELFKITDYIEEEECLLDDLLVESVIFI
jgi:hypothetical protein